MASQNIFGLFTSFAMFLILSFEIEKKSYTLMIK